MDPDLNPDLPTYTLKTICVCLESSGSTKFISKFPVFVLMSLNLVVQKKVSGNFVVQNKSSRACFNLPQGSQSTTNDHD